MNTEIIKLEEQLIQAIIQSDLQVLQLLLHEDMLFVNHFGMLLTRDQDLAPHANGDLKIKSIVTSDQHIQQFGDTYIVVVSKVIDGTYQGQSFESSVKFTRVWQRFNEAWKVIAASSVPN